MVSANKVRVGYCVQHRGPDGQIENKLIVFLDWDRETWLNLFPIYKAAESIVAAPFTGRKTAPDMDKRN